MKEQPEFRVIKPENIPENARMIRGEEYLAILDRVRGIVFHQRDNGISKGIRGFIFHGDVGLGKTMIAKALAHELASYLIFIDGSDIARPLYGQAESQINEAFRIASDTRYRHTVILIDDCESVFPARGWLKAESWHIAQNNVFFHELDNVDTSKTAVVLTTNRYDLLDAAIIDRLMSIEFPKPSPDTLGAFAEMRTKELAIGEDGVQKIIQAVNSEGFESIRKLDRRILEVYLAQIGT